jgi:hypothetical protein
MQMLLNHPEILHFVKKGKTHKSLWALIIRKCNFSPNSLPE